MAWVSLFFFLTFPQSQPSIKINGFCANKRKIESFSNGQRKNQTSKSRVKNPIQSSRSEEISFFFRDPFNTSFGRLSRLSLTLVENKDGTFKFLQFRSVPWYSSRKLPDLVTVSSDRLCYSPLAPRSVLFKELVSPDQKTKKEEKKEVTQLSATHLVTFQTPPKKKSIQLRRLPNKELPWLNKLPISVAAKQLKCKLRWSRGWVDCVRGTPAREKKSRFWLLARLLLSPTCARVRRTHCVEPGLTRIHWEILSMPWLFLSEHAKDQGDGMRVNGKHRDGARDC